MEAADTEVADTEAAVTSAGVTLAGVTSAEVTSPAVTSAEAAPVCMLAGLTCTLAGPMSPEIAAVGLSAEIAAVGLAGGVMAGGVTTDPMPPAIRTEGFIRTAMGRNELKPMGVLNAHLVSHEGSRLFTSVPEPVGPSTRCDDAPCFTDDRREPVRHLDLICERGRS
jgi:hypothetical protein